MCAKKNIRTKKKTTPIQKCTAAPNGIVFSFVDVHPILLVLAVKQLWFKAQQRQLPSEQSPMVPTLKAQPDSHAAISPSASTTTAPSLPDSRSCTHLTELSRKLSSHRTCHLLVRSGPLRSRSLPLVFVLPSSG